VKLSIEKSPCEKSVEAVALSAPIILVLTNSQRYIAALVKWLLTLVQTFEVIALFGSLAFFSWLTFQKLFDDDIKTLDSEDDKRKGRANLQTIKGYFFASSMFFFVAATLEWAVTQQTMPLYNNSALVDLEVLTGVFGFLTFVAPIWIVQEMGKNAQTFAQIEPPAVSNTLFIGFICLANSVVFLLRGILTYSTLSPVELIIFYCVFLSYFGALILFENWGKRGLVRKLWYVMLLSPWIVVMFAVFFTK
jgi:hypothetical protein